MWADTLLGLERGHLERLAVWGAGSVLLGTMLVAWLTGRRVSAPLLRHFAIQTAAWGAVDVALCAWAWRGLALRNYAAAQQLVNFLWLNIGLDVGYVMLGATLLISCWRLGPRPAGVGAGLGIMLQGAALFLLDVRLVVLIGPLQ
jgi:hypothetical protein